MRDMMLVFLGACSYGVLSTIVKIAYSQGYVPSEVIGSQIFFGCILLWTLALLFSRKKVAWKQWLPLMAVGVTTCLTSIFYYMSLQTIPASIAIVLLFQFTWMGVLIESVAQKQVPSQSKVISILILAVGTLLAGGVFGTQQMLDKIGLMYGLLSAITFALFIFFSGRIGLAVPSITRSAIISTGTLVAACLILPPTFLIDGTLLQGLWLWGLLLGLFGLFIPTLFFSIGVPKIGTGMATILGAAELPTAVLMSSLVLKEFVGVLQWIGVLFIFAGMIYPQWRGNQRKKARELTR
ncbi:EamA family transporter [Metabacillus iocasae]|uniref:Drug/metabolite transporter (DMT)-like permease n=1 Tax=Priestia iocasae TaxID=2291674 RepID=A0ABS2QWA5_9BACI|nr:EamA family transporter [Metabacillus iocasae]MBM7703227.1 drug/metabolite transporter (DMT)-like permease [Metabacillus iocasae]